MLVKGRTFNLRGAIVGALLLAGGTAAAWAPTSAYAAPAPCEEACLRGVMDGYLSAMLSHTPKLLQLTSDARFTENGVTISFGQGLWATGSGPVAHKIYVPDPQKQTIGFIGALTENGKPVYFSARLRLRGGKIAEAETMVARGAMVAKEIMPSRASLAELTPVSDRLPRQKLIEISGKYFDAFSHSDGRLAPFAPDCARLENGIGATTVAPMPGEQPLGCAEGMSKMPPLATASHRRVLAVDETRNLVLWAAVFDMTGVVTPEVAAWFKTAPPQMNDMLAQIFVPSSGPLMELFRIRDGKLAEIEAVFYPHPLPYGFPTGWD